MTNSLPCSCVYLHDGRLESLSLQVQVARPNQPLHHVPSSIIPSLVKTARKEFHFGTNGQPRWDAFLHLATLNDVQELPQMSLHVGSIFDVRTRLVPNIRLACRCEIFTKITLCFANSDLDGNAVLVCLAHLLNHSSRLQDLCLAGRATFHPSNRINLE